MAQWRSAFIRKWFRGLSWLKSAAAATLPPNAWLRLTGLLRGRLASTDGLATLTESWRQARSERAASDRHSAPPGINVIGYLRAAKGIGEAARRTLASAAAAEIPHSAVDYEVDIPASLRGEAHPGALPRGFAFNTNLLHINPPQLPYLWAHFSAAELARRYNVGIWYWESPGVPLSWRSAFGLVDEVWAGSRFVQESLSALSPVPVVVIPPSVGPAPDPALTRESLGLRPGAFLYLCAYDLLSSSARKNPEGAIRAFKRAFPATSDDIGLIVKVMNSAFNPGALKNLRREVADRPDIQILDQLLSRAEMSSLTNLVDVFVSLHRSEGFGLIGAEAMYLGKPAVMTGWSGNADYMDSTNSCSVSYALVPVGPGADPYAPDGVWAEPDLQQAAGYLQRLHADRSYYQAISANAAQTMRRQYSPAVVGALMRGRLREVGVMD